MEESGCSSTLRGGFKEKKLYFFQQLKITKSTSTKQTKREDHLKSYIIFATAHKKLRFRLLTKKSEKKHLETV